MDIILGTFAFEIIKALQALNDFLPVFDLSFLIITQLGDSLVYIVMLVIIYWIFSKKYGIRLAFLVVMTLYLTNIVKSVFKVSRPYEVSTGEIRQITTEEGYSFFSGHSSTSGSFWGYLILIRRNKFIIGLSIALIILVPLSRVYLAVHWPTDVIVGVIVGLLMAFIMYKYSDDVVKSLERLNIFN
ncbi:MAG: phosphatase PAP2 family protein [Candidatus Hodarchaeales archaeon]